MVSPVRFPTEVILLCAAVVTVPAWVALVAFPAKLAAVRVSLCGLYCKSPSVTRVRAVEPSPSAGINVT